MSDMTPDRVRAAGEYLRTRAWNATPGPWYATSKSDRYGGIVGPVRDKTPTSEVEGYGGELIAETVRGGNGMYLQVVRPEFGRAVAAWLIAQAGIWDASSPVRPDDAKAVEDVVTAVEAAQREPLVKSVIVA